MATKIYRLNQSKNSATFPLYTNHGKMRIDYTFKDGNQLMRQPARCTLYGEFYQELLEESPLFQNGIITLERVIEDEKKSSKKSSAPQKEQVEEVTSPEQAIEYVFNTWGIVVKSGKQAVKIASQKNVEFPFLQEKNTEK